jgi:quercetin dioxygenase-like cupin family protein
LTYVEMGPGWTVPPHSHTAKEIIHVLDGSLTPSGSDQPLGAGGSLVVGADVVYGFSCGPTGVKFLIYRQNDAAIKFVG